jgi:hypothetical protein
MEKHDREMAEIRDAQKQFVTDVGQVFRRARRARSSQRTPQAPGIG